jgi:uncharacterized protein (UPF0332 family)
MEVWHRWLAMAYESTDAAEVAEDASLWRAALNRRYFAAFHAATAMLHYRGLLPPMSEGVRREAWAHADLGLVLRDQMSPLIRSRVTRSQLAAALGDLYQWRVAGDYQASWSASAQVQRTAARLSRWTVAVATGVIGEVPE